MSPRPAITALFTDLYEITMALGLFTDEFVQQLSEVRFTGDVWAVPEGTVVFSNEPILQVIAPILEAQLVETFVVNQIHLQSVIASKAARVIEAAACRSLLPDSNKSDSLPPESRDATWRQVCRWRPRHR